MTERELLVGLGQALSSEDVAIRHVGVWRCPGYAVNGNVFRCHPDEEPGGYDVRLGLMHLNSKPMTLDEANEYAQMLIAQVARVVDYERRGVMDTGKRTPPPWRAEMFDWGPGACGTEGTKILRRMVDARGRLLFARRRAGIARFDVEGEGGATYRSALSRPPNMRTVPWDEVMILERGGYILREPGSDRERGSRTITDFGRAEAGRWPARPSPLQQLLSTQEPRP